MFGRDGKLLSGRSVISLMVSDSDNLPLVPGEASLMSGDENCPFGDESLSVTKKQCSDCRWHKVATTNIKTQYFDIFHPKIGDGPLKEA